MQRLSLFFYMEAKLKPLEKRIKNWHNSKWNFLDEQPDTTFWPQKKWRNFGRAESRTNWRVTKKIQIELATTFNKNEKQQDAKNYSEF
jgi:hypothetical protein